jgi:heme/copper-type cytochrome/quinol oxidase subunit 1
MGSLWSKTVDEKYLKFMITNPDVWVHHFFTMGAGPNVNAVFGITSCTWAVPQRRDGMSWRSCSPC